MVYAPFVLLFVTLRRFRGGFTGRRRGRLGLFVDFVQLALQRADRGLQLADGGFVRVDLALQRLGRALEFAHGGVDGVAVLLRRLVGDLVHGVLKLLFAGFHFGLFSGQLVPLFKQRLQGRALVRDFAGQHHLFQCHFAILAFILIFHASASRRRMASYSARRASTPVSL